MATAVSDASNDILADRRLAWAKELPAEGDHAAAADLLEQVVAIVPGWAPAWAALGEARERSAGLRLIPSPAKREKESPSSVPAGSRRGGTSPLS